MSLFDFYMEIYSSGDLKAWVDLCGGPKVLTRKADRAEFLVRTMTSPVEVHRLWDALDDLSRKAVAAAYYNEGTFHADAFVARYGSLPERPSDGWSSYGKPILMDVFIPGGIIHPEVMPLLAPLVPEPDRFRLEGVAAETVAVTIGGEQIPCTIARREEPGRRDLLALLSLANQGQLLFNSSGSRLTPRGVELLRGQLAEGDFAGNTIDEPIICFGLPMFALQAGLVTRQGKLTAAGTRYLASEDPDLLLDAFEHWSETGDFDAVTRLQAVRGMRARGVRLTLPAERNQRIVEALSWCPAGVWIALQDFYRAIKIWHFDFEIEQGGLDKLYVGYSGYNNYGEWASVQDMWLLTNGLYINAVLWETLAALGALDIAYLDDAEGMFPAEPYFYDEANFSRYDGLICFRINPLGAFLFGQADAYNPARPVDEALFSVAADGRITLLPHAALSAAHHAQLAQIGDIVVGGYQLSVPKLLALLETAPNLDQPRTFLDQRNSGPLPSAIGIDQLPSPAVLLDEVAVDHSIPLPYAAACGGTIWVPTDEGPQPRSAPPATSLSDDSAITGPLGSYHRRPIALLWKTVTGPHLLLVVSFRPTPVSRVRQEWMRRQPRLRTVQRVATVTCLGLGAFAGLTTIASSCSSGS